MKKFIKELLRPVDDILFNWMTRSGFIKPFLSSLIGPAIGIAGSLIGGNQKRQAAKGARNAQERALMLAEEQYRDPSNIIQDVYGDLYSPETQDVILGAERRLM